MRAGGTLALHRLDRIADSETTGIQTINEFHDRGIDIKSFSTESEIVIIDALGRAPFCIVAAFAQLRVDTIRDNTSPWPRPR